MIKQKPVALVTGASSGIGAVFADRLADRGYDLVLVARRVDRLRALASRLMAARGIDVRIIGADLTDDADLARIETFVRAEQRLAMLVNNAGNGKLITTSDTSDADADFTMRLNMVAPTRLCRAALPGLLARGEGAIINIASIMAFEVLPVTTLYSATKSFMLVLSQGLQAELAGTGVRVQVVLPASTATDFWDGSGVPLSALDQSTVMTVDAMVDAALAGFDRNEDVTLPSVEDERLSQTYEAARRAIFEASQTGAPATRYSITP